MKKYLLISLFAVGISQFHSTVSFGQAGGVYTVAGGGTSTADGVPATSALLSSTSGIGVDALGNVYVADVEQHKIRKIDVTAGIITTVAGTGVSGYTGDGGPAISAKIGEPEAIFVDRIGNIYLADNRYKVIRKVDAGSGIIHSVSGGGSSYLEGIPALNASIGQQLSVFVDDEGNIYHSGPIRINKVEASTGIISIVAGGGTSMAEDIPARNAWLSSSMKSISFDASGNMYLISNNGTSIRKVDPIAGHINTICGSGTSTADGIPAILSSISQAYSCPTDALGNLFIADRWAGNIRRIDATTGNITTIAGGGTSTLEGAPALSALVHPYQLCLDAAHNTIYYTDSASTVKKFQFSPIAGSAGTPADSFKVYVNRLCNGPEVTVIPRHYAASMTVHTDFGDGTTDVSPVVPGFLNGGYMKVAHTYPASGNYIITQVLFNGATPLDTITTPFAYTFCRSFPIHIFYDGNGNCIKDPTEPFAIRPSVTEVDSNGVPVANISATSGFTYSAYGLPGDVYTFRIVSTSGEMIQTCPMAVGITSTLAASVAGNPVKEFGLACPTSTIFDLSANAIIPVTGVNDQWGNIYVRNNSCFPQSADVTLNFSPKYVYTSDASPHPTSSTASSITWHLPNLSADDVAPVDLYYAIFSNPATGLVPIRDTVRSYITVSPTSGDSNPGNNIVNILDTVRAGCDPNEIFVSPAGCIASGTAANTLQYTIHFENTGNDTAHNIYVMDTLSDYVDPATMRIVNSSAEMFVSVLHNATNHTVLKFDFPNINLLDSSHHNECNGSVIYTINTRPGLADGVNVFNYAGIFFDYNGVVMTNKVENTIGCPPPVHTRSFSKVADAKIYPNPATSELTIEMAHDAYQSVIISNIMGQQLVQQSISSNHIILDIRQLPVGMYFATLRGIGGTVTTKFTKE